MGEDIGLGSPRKFSIGKVLVIVIIIVAGLGMVFGIGYFNMRYPSSNSPTVAPSRPLMATNHPPIATVKPRKSLI